jgi:hypothetical protein
MTTQDEDQDIVYSSAYNPFPEPQTIPSGWDTSGFFSTPAPASTQAADDSADSESYSS